MNLKIKPISHKYKILYRKARYKVLYGGRASGKSWAVAEALIYYAIKYGVRILCAREVQKSIETSSYQLILDTITRLGVAHLFEVTRNKITCTQTGATFIFHGLSTATEQSIKSMEGIDIVWIEEAQTITQQSLNLLIPTIRKPGSEIWFTYNPGLPSDPVSRMFQGGRLPTGALVERVNFYDNPMVSDEIKQEAEDCKNNNPSEYAHIWEGGYQEDGDDLFINLREVAIAQRRMPEFSEVPVIAGLDVARFGNDRSALVVRKGAMIDAIHFWSKLSLTDLHDQVVSKVIELGIDVLVVDGVGVGAGLVDTLNKSLGSIKVVEFNGAYKAGNSKYCNARAETWQLMKEWIADCGVLPLDLELEAQLTTIKYLINTRQQLQLESKQDLKKRGIESPDIADALSMTFYTGSKADTKQIINKLYGGASQGWHG